jgi:lipid-A-disaccharide synthase
MKPKQIMLVAGDPSGDANAADLVRALAQAVPAAEFKITHDMQPLTSALAPRFFGAGGPKMAAAGVELAFDLTSDAVIGPGGLVNKLPRLLRQFKELKRLAIERQPDLIILVDYGEFNLRLAHAIRGYLRARRKIFFNWRPKIVQYISPQVWASRPGRAKKLARDYDLVISVFPFEEEWYAKRVPQLPVRYVGNPIFDRYPEGSQPVGSKENDALPPLVLLLPGSRRGELKRHIPVMAEAARLIAARQKTRFLMIVPNESMAELAKMLLTEGQTEIGLQVGGLKVALLSAALALTKSGTITMECAKFRVPAVVIYKTDMVTYWLARWLVTVKYLAMPNLLAGEAVYPELIQGQATAHNIAAAALDWLTNPKKRDLLRGKLDKVFDSLAVPRHLRIAGCAPGPAKLAARTLIQLMNRGGSVLGETKSKKTT